MSNKVILDLDDVQGDFLSDMLIAFNKHTGIRKEKKEITSTDLSLFYPGVTSDIMQEIFIEHLIIERMKPIAGAVQATHLLKDAGYEVSVVTARNWHPKGEQITSEWLESQGFHYDRLCVTNLGENKLEAYQRISNKFALIADDQIKNIDHAVESQLFENVALISNPWNNQDHRFIEGKSRFDSLISVTKDLLSGRIPQ